MHIIGITGTTGAGKTIAMRALERRIGALALDCDEIYHELLKTNSQMTDEIKACFKDITTDGEIDRKKLAKIVFNDPLMLAALEKITHKYVMNEVERRIAAHESSGGKTAVICAIALIEIGYSKKCATVISITAPKEERLKRLMTRDGLTREEALTRINAQKPDEFYAKNSDHTIVNTYKDIKTFEDELCKYITEKASGKA